MATVTASVNIAIPATRTTARSRRGFTTADYEAGCGWIEQEE
jgi:hypothetical protein